MRDIQENNNNMVGDNPSPYCQDGVRSASMMLFWWHHVTTTYDEYAPTMNLCWRIDLSPCCWDILPRKQLKGYPGSISASWSKRPSNSPSTFTTSLNHSAPSSSYISSCFIRIRGPSCDFVNYLMKFTNWRERKNRPVFERLI